MSTGSCEGASFVSNDNAIRFPGIAASTTRKKCSMAIVRAPLRISFVGGGSDLPVYQGATVSASIDKYVYVIAKWRRDRKVILHWRQREEVGDSGDLKHDLIKTVLVEEGIHNGIEITTFADVPGVGSGLGSSAATTTAALVAVLTLKGYTWIDRQWLARRVCFIELDRLGRVGGSQDQWSSAVGGFLYLRHFDGAVIDVKPIPVTPTQSKRLFEYFMVFGPQDSKGRDSQTILRQFSPCPEFREECMRLCDKFVTRFLGSQFEHLGELVGEHRILKEKSFPYLSKENSEAITGTLTSQEWKLCGAGETGHLLVATEIADREFTRNNALQIWGPELPVEMTDHGAEVIYRE